MHVGCTPDAEFLVLRDLGHILVFVLLTGRRDDDTSAQLDVHHLDAIAVKLRNVTAQGIWIGHGSEGVPVEVAHGSTCPQCAARSTRSSASTLAVAHSRPRSLTSVITDLFGEHVDAQVRVRSPCAA